MDSHARALAVKFHYPMARTPTSWLHIEGFPARHLRSSRFSACALPPPLPASLASDATPRFLESHPCTAPFIERLTKKPVPASYGQPAIYRSMRRSLQMGAADLRQTIHDQ